MRICVMCSKEIKPEENFVALRDLEEPTKYVFVHKREDNDCANLYRLAYLASKNLRV